jgi:hypothetical protein
MLSKDEQMDLMAQLGDIALKLGWVIAVPPTEMTEGIIMGTLNYVSNIDSLLDEDSKLDVLIHNDQMEEIERNLSNPDISEADIENNLISTNIMPSKGVLKKGGHNVH